MCCVCVCPVEVSWLFWVCCSRHCGCKQRKQLAGHRDHVRPRGTAAFDFARVSHLPRAGSLGPFPFPRLWRSLLRLQLWQLQLGLWDQGRGAGHPNEVGAIHLPTGPLPTGPLPTVYDGFFCVLCLKPRSLCLTQQCPWPNLGPNRRPGPPPLLQTLQALLGDRRRRQQMEQRLCGVQRYGRHSFD